jgi:hypothetical protein
MVLPSEISGTNDIGNINNRLDDTTDIYYVNTDNNKIRCPEGYVFENSHLLFDGKDRSTINYNINTDQWLNLKNEEVPWSSSTIRCKRKYCDPLGIVDSDKEYDVVIDDTTDSSNLVTCNGGYVFDTTNTRLGKVKCGVIPIMNAIDFSKENKIGWLVDDSYNELYCEGLNETDCNSIDLPISISKNTEKLYDDNGKSLRCTWIPPIDDTVVRENGDPGSGFIRTQGQCKFIHRSDLNHTEPICRAMYCNSKEIPNSNRTTTSTGPLPGPDTGSIHGDCINFDGKIIDNITNSSDCACFQHKSCDMCTNNENCQWCGSSDDGRGYCYSTKTHLSICDSSIRHDRGGTCIHPKTHIPKSAEPIDGWTKEDCENTVCVNKNHWDSLDENNYMSDKNDPQLYNNDMTGPDDCRYGNTFWDETALIHAPDKCIVKNNRLDRFDLNSSIPYYPLTIGANTGLVKFNISDDICVPNSPIDNNAITTCNGLSKNGCENDPTCSWGDNLLKDSNFNWSDLKYIEFNESDTCPIKSSTGTDKYKFNIEKRDGYINLLDSSLSTIVGDYINTCSIVRPTEQKNIVSQSICSSLGGPSSGAIHNCEPPNIRYCDIDSGLCPGGSTIIINGNIVPGCAYYEQQSVDVPAGNMCYGDLVDYNCSTNDTELYNCDKTLSGNNTTNQSQCTTTQYNVIGTGTDLISSNVNSVEFISPNVDSVPNIPNNIKDYIICDTSIGDNTGINAKKRCELIGDDYAHWSKLCTDDLGNKYSVKQICNLHPQSTWGKYIESGGNNLDWGCYNDIDGSKYSDQEVCGLFSTVDNQQSKIVLNELSMTNGSIIIQIQGINIIPTGPTNVSVIPVDSIIEQSDTSGIVSASGSILSDTPISITSSNINILTLSGEFTDDILTIKDSVSDQIIATVDRPTVFNRLNVLSLDSSAETCIIDGSPSGDTFNDYKYMCEDSTDHTIGFNFLENSDTISDTGVCKYRRNRDEVTINGVLIDDPANCTTNNKYFINEYEYNSNNTCPKDDQTKPDIPTNWTGGEISSQDGIHISECSPSIMSSCNVDCNPGYGGGGEYVCLYNQEGGDICDKINDKSEQILNNKQLMCESYPACVYDLVENRCYHNPNIENDGNLEWIGSSCHNLDNTAFSHGIAKLPGLDDDDSLLKPFVRVFIYLVFYTLFASLFIYITLKWGLEIAGETIDYILNKSFDIMNKIISLFTNSDKLLFDFVLSSNIDYSVKLTSTAISIGLFIISYFVLQYFKSDIKEFVNNFGIYYNNLKEVFSRITMPNIRGVTIGGIDTTGAVDAVGGAGDAVSGAAGTAASTAGDGIDQTIDSISEQELLDDDLKTINVIIQISVSLLIVVMVIIVIRKSDLIG